ncbi:hypothetical protein GUITHDRAFT_81305 [Guillardia theta CCMP2712]|uniref:Uncharacterized protein n=1 Tax=Guillardia theta (strain CCMP2712) TaxID=905079 RepID=L1IBC6_GUITC|nr:hypothetical protein GUITHDRAFT_81305 [Guillardia theta CCMP2712]EKX33533.1 hypothetical protein GUITHDRAFT_81305 [Guillardia theta CCMP2712]|eukprot:XP_005820513.1 hypothetical protein GUITHDRAFT_81305 [Guillardia theta CCMP2712]
MIYVISSSIQDIYPSSSSSSSSSSSFLGTDALRALSPVIRVTIGWAVLLYTFLFYQSWTKFYAHKKMKDDSKKDTKPPSLMDVKYNSAAGSKYLALNGDRTVGNMLEQSTAFLVALWMHALFINVKSAAQLGWVWLTFRGLYPLVFDLGVPWLLVSTVPDYLVIAALLLPVCQMVL